MEVKVCRRCKKMFQYIIGPEICPKCKQFEEEVFQKVNEYLRENPDATLHEVSQGIDASARLIERFLKQGRLQVAIESPIAPSCERCGEKVTTGRYCEVCKNEIAQELSEIKQSLMKENTKKDVVNGGMRFLQADSKK